MCVFESALNRVGVVGGVSSRSGVCAVCHVEIRRYSAGRSDA